MASFISYTILYAVLIISVFQRAFAQMSTLQTGCEGTTPNAQDTCPRNYFPHYDAVLTEKISNDLQYQISPDTQVIDLRGSLDWHVRSYKPIDLVHFLSTCTGPICAIKGDAGHIYSAYGLYSEYCYARRDQRYWNTTNEPTLTTVTDHTTQTPPPATSIMYVTSLLPKRLRSDREPFATNGGLPSCYVKFYTNPVFLDLAKLEARS